MSKSFLFTVIGSYGDLHPVLALGLELQRRGHRVTIATNDYYKEKVEDLGFGFLAIRPWVSDVGPEEEWAGKVINGRFGSRYLIKKLIAPYTRENFDILINEARNYDVLISHMITFATPLVAQKLKKPWAAIVLQPVTLLSRYDLPVLPQAPWISEIYPKLPEFLKTVLLKSADRVAWSWLKPVAKLYNEQNLKRPTASPLFGGQFSPYLNLLLFSEVIAKPQRDWPQPHLITGFPLYDADKESELSATVVEFLEAGSSPIIFTLGSSAVLTAGDFYRYAAQATLELGLRAILLIGRDQRNRTGIPSHPDLHISEYEPYSKLLSKGKLVVHSGGIGSVAQGLNAGVPQIIVPFANDQPDNAKRIENLGVGLSLPKKILNKENLKSRIQRILSSEEYFSKAKEIRSKLLSESPVQTAADALERL